jgi:hypothetical protein
MLPPPRSYYACVYADKANKVIAADADKDADMRVTLAGLPLAATTVSVRRAAEDALGDGATVPTVLLGKPGAGATRSATLFVRLPPSENVADAADEVARKLNKSSLLFGGGGGVRAEVGRGQKYGQVRTRCGACCLVGPVAPALSVSLPPHAL